MTERRIKNDANEIAREEQNFCLNHCPHPNAKDCRWIPRQCMAEVKRGNKPNPHLPHGEIKYLLLNKDWSNCTIEEIANELGSTYYSIKALIVKHKKETGYVIPHEDGRQRRWGK